MYVQANVHWLHGNGVMSCFAAHCRDSYVSGNNKSADVHQSRQGACCRIFSCVASPLLPACPGGPSCGADPSAAPPPRCGATPCSARLPPHSLPRPLGAATWRRGAPLHKLSRIRRAKSSSRQQGRGNLAACEADFYSEAQQRIPGPWHQPAAESGAWLLNALPLHSAHKPLRISGLQPMACANDPTLPGAHCRICWMVCRVRSDISPVCLGSPQLRHESVRACAHQGRGCG